MFWIIGGDYLVRALPDFSDSRVTRALSAQMEHCAWAGFHFYDLIFPLFVFLVGVSLVFSLSNVLQQNRRTLALKRIALRSLILFSLGILYMGGVANGFSNVYLAGVLHRIAVAYFFAALIFCFCRIRVMIGICVGLLIGYWVLMIFVPVPGLDQPSLAKPGLNLAHYIDVRYLPGRKFEGTLLSTMPAVANCLLGVFAGLLLRNPHIAARQKVRWLLGCGSLSLGVGFLWAETFPIIKLLWTSSYVLVACGYSAILLGMFFQVIEIWNYKKWAQPFVWIGMNALTIYLVANVVNFRGLALRFVGGDVKYFLGPYGQAVQALVAISLALAVVYFLHRRKIFLRL